MQAAPIINAPRLRSPAGGLTVEGRYFRPGCFLPESARPTLEAVAAKAAAVAVADPVEVGILGQSYRVRSIPIAASVGTVAFLVIPKHKAESYHLHRSNEGEVVCSCGDFIHRWANSGTMCKHGRALAELGLIASTTPRILPPFSDRKPLPEPWTAPTPTCGNRYEPSPEECQEAAQLFVR